MSQNASKEMAPGTTAKCSRNANGSESEAGDYIAMLLVVNGMKRKQ